MAISKRLRFEILRRDNHACRYCGAVAPGVVLTVDHVVPTALGGTDDPTNLVAACRDCNSGKSATPLDGHLVADIRQDALRWARAMRTAVEEAQARVVARQQYVADFDHRWSSWHYGEDQGEKVPRSSDWEEGVGRWHDLGVPFEIVEDAIRRAMVHNFQHRHRDDAEFRFTCRIVWDEIDRLNLRTSALVEDADAYEGGRASMRDYLLGTFGYSMLVARALSDAVDNIAEPIPYGAL